MGQFILGNLMISCLENERQHVNKQSILFILTNLCLVMISNKMVKFLVKKKFRENTDYYPFCCFFGAAMHQS